MAPKYWKYDEKGKLLSAHTRQKDPVATRESGEIRYLGLPQCCTEIEPPIVKSGYDLYFTGNSWEYREIVQEENVENISTERDNLISEYMTVQGQLDQTDWIVIKIHETALFAPETDIAPLIQKYAPQIERRIAWRKRINELESLITASDNK